MARLIVCVRCGHARPHACRQLCATCETHERARRRVHRWPAALTEAELYALAIGPKEDRVRAYASARAAGMTPPEAARRIGVSPATATDYERSAA
ncbi:hypothetical protein [Streptomonospora wellingtoniae]|uniref:Helix-turn-helix domain-containing protein n=1 Tax=Streptomonospora wellingtoniae TaxID=3075544 RepID=A0ABU2KUT7_9ACTN|nr:hypothetical protein [Streptomonospora sp. DSM 45055]MDT0302951.1 hypothetical protein [Streptomonospora sp. DSM 45055]